MRREPMDCAEIQADPAERNDEKDKTTTATVSWGSDIATSDMSQPIKTENAKPSTRLKTRKVPLVNIRGSIWRETIITPTLRHRLTLHHLMSRQVTRLRAKMSEAGYYGWHKRIEF